MNPSTIADFPQIKADALTAQSFFKDCTPKVTASGFNDHHSETFGLVVRLSVPRNGNPNIDGIRAAVVIEAKDKVITEWIARHLPELGEEMAKAMDKVVVIAAKECASSAIEILSISNAE